MSKLTSDEITSDPHHNSVIIEDFTTEPKSQPQPQPNHPPRLDLRTLLALLSICLIYFTQTFALVGTGAQGQFISAYFNRPSDYIWLTACLTIPSVVLGPIIAQMADYWGRRWPLVISSLFGAVGCVIASRADNYNMVLGGLTVTGLEFGVLPLLHAVPSEILPRRWRAPAQAAVMIANSFGLILGLVIGGVLSRGDQEGFRRYYYIATALFAGAAVICFVAYKPPPTRLQASLTLHQKLSQLDWIGYMLLASSLVLFCIGLAWSQNPYPWSDPHTSATFSIGAALGVLLVVYETKFKADGMFHHGLFHGENMNFAIALFAVFCEGLAFFAATIGFLYQDDQVLAAVRFSIAFMATIPASIATGIYCTIAKKVRWITVISFLIFVAFFACMATTDQDSATNVWGYPVLLGSALGMTLITLVTTAQLSIPPELISVASGLLISIRSLGGTVGIAIYNAVFIDETQHAPGRIARAALSAGLPRESTDELVQNIMSHNEAGIARVPGVTPQIVESSVTVLLNTFIAGFQHVWITAACFVSLATIATVFLVDPSTEFNDQIDAPVDKKEHV